MRRLSLCLCVLVAMAPGVICRADDVSDISRKLTPIFGQIERSYRSNDVRRIEAFGRSALTMHGQRRLYGVWVTLNVYKTHRADDKLSAWIADVRAVARRENDHDLATLADYFETCVDRRALGPDPAAWTRFAQSNNPAIRLIGLGALAKAYWFTNQWARASETLLQALSEAAAQGAAALPVEAELHQDYALVLADAGHIDGAMDELLAASAIDAKVPMPTEDLHRIYDLSELALRAGDLESADRLARIHYRLAQTSEGPKPRYWTRYLCAEVASERQEWQRVLDCTDSLTAELAAPATVPQVTLLVDRAIARARLHDLAGARSDLSALSRLPADLAPTSATLNQVGLYVARAEGRNGEAFEALDQWRRDNNRWVESRHRQSVSQVVVALNEALRRQKAQSANLQKAVGVGDQLNLALGTIAVLLGLMISGALGWGLNLRRMSKRLQRTMLEAQAASAAKSVFLASMSHEIRTPLNGVLGMAQILATKDLRPDQRECVEVIGRSGETLLALLNDVLDLSKIEAGKLDLERTEFDLGRLVADTIRHYAGLADEKGIALTVDRDPAEGVFMGDPVRIRQILGNLISNALKFTQDGDVRVTSFFSDGRLALSVHDTGIGIPADKLDKLFSKFSQVDDSTTRRFGGTGLGLSICRELSELMGGEITVESREGVGSTFTATFALTRIADRSVPDPAALVADDAGVMEVGLRVLAAEDNPTNQLVLRAMLEQVGVDVVLVGDGQACVDAWQDQAWDVILMDIQMPVLDGVSATRMIREREREQHRPRTPIIALTANTMTHQIEEYSAAGVDRHVAKPISAAKLFAALEAACQIPDETDEPCLATA